MIWREKARQAIRRCQAEGELASQGEGSKHIPLNKLCVHGAYTEDRTRWKEELKVHGAKVYKDLEEDNGTQEKDQVKQVGGMKCMRVCAVTVL